MFIRLYAKPVFLIVGFISLLILIGNIMISNYGWQVKTPVGNHSKSNIMISNYGWQVKTPVGNHSKMYNEENEESRDQLTEHLSLNVQKRIETLLLFIGYPRSGHTLIGSLLDAHPHIVIANEYNLLSQWQNWTSGQRNARHLCNTLYENSRDQATMGYRAKDKKGRTYFVPGQWQGRFKNFIKIIGDKKGGRTTKFIDSSIEKLREISKVVKLPIKMVHVVRNPYDNIATMVRRHLKIQRSDELIRKPINKTWLVKAQIIHYKALAVKNQKLLQRLGSRVITIHSEDVIKNPAQILKNVCTFLDVKCSEEYLKDCASIVYKKPSQTRYTVVWPKGSRKSMLTMLGRVPFLRRYMGKSWR